jgi:hypothetical protein
MVTSAMLLCAFALAVFVAVITDGEPGRQGVCWRGGVLRVQHHELCTKIGTQGMNLYVR